MTLYLRAITRKREVLWHEIQTIIDGFPKGNTDNDEMNVNDDGGSGDAAWFITFKKYHDLREIRLALEAEQSAYFLVEELVEGDINEKIEEIVPAALTRSLGADFLVPH